MKIIIRTKNFDLDEDIREYVNEKFSLVEKFIKNCHSNNEWEKIKDSCEVFIEVEKETKRHNFRSTARVHILNTIIEADEEAKSVRESIDKLKDEFIEEIKKYKSRMIDKNRKEQREFKKENRSVA